MKDDEAIQQHWRATAMATEEPLPASDGSSISLPQDLDIDISQDPLDLYDISQLDVTNCWTASPLFSLTPSAEGPHAPALETPDVAHSDMAGLSCLPRSLIAELM
eukprot:685662-Pyramimonas_sp.AAC.1